MIYGIGEAVDGQTLALYPPTVNYGSRGIWRGRKAARRNQPPPQPDLVTSTTLNPTGPHSAVKRLTCVNKPSPTSVGTPECTLPRAENFRWDIPERILHLSKGFTLLKLLIDWVWTGRGRRCFSLFETGVVIVNEVHIMKVSYFYAKSWVLTFN